MKEHQPKSDNQQPPREVSGKIIFDIHGNSIGVAVNDGSFDYAPLSEKINTVVVIRPLQKGK